MRRTAHPFVLAAFAVVLSASVPAVAQDGRVIDARENPFLPHTTDEEDRRIAERERMRQVFREMMPEVKSIVQVEVTGLRQQLGEDAKKSALDALKADPTLQAVQAGTLQANALGTSAGAKPNEPAAVQNQDGTRSKLPDGAKFVACISPHGVMKALYKDAKDGSRFVYDPPRGSASPCA